MINGNDPKNEFEKIDFEKNGLETDEPEKTEPEKTEPEKTESEKTETDNWDEKPKYDGPEEKRYYTQYTPPTPGNGIIPERPVMPPRDADGKTSKILGFIGLALALCLNQIAGIVLGIIGLCKANKSIRTLGYKSSDANVGKVLGIINIIVGCLMFALIVAYAAFFYSSLFEWVEEFANEGTPSDFDWSITA